MGCFIGKLPGNLKVLDFITTLNNKINFFITVLTGVDGVAPCQQFNENKIFHEMSPSKMYSRKHIIFEGKIIQVIFHAPL